MAPTSGNDGRMVQEWLTDYGTYVGNREDYARRLRTDPGARFYETEKRAGRADQHPDRHLGHGQRHGVLHDAPRTCPERYRRVA